MEASMIKVSILILKLTCNFLLYSVNFFSYFELFFVSILRYSLSLVFWEIIRRFQSNDHRACQYEVPYQHKVPSDPSFDDMKKVVCFEQFRPEIPYEIQTNPLLSSTCKLIRETWSKNPSSRLNALRIKKTLISLNSTDQTLPLMPLSTSTAV